MAGAYLVLPLLWLTLERPIWVLLAWVSAPMASRLAHALRRASDGPAFNAILAGTARLSLLFCLLLALGLILPGG